MDVIKTAYDLIRKWNRLNEEKRSYEMVVNARKVKKKQKAQAEDSLRKIHMELYQIDRQLRDLPHFYKMYSMYEMEQCIKNEERYKDIISKLEEMKEEIEMNRDWANLEYYIAKDKVDPEGAEDVAKERRRIRTEMDQQAKAELAGAFGKEFDEYLFDGAMEETDELLDGNMAARAEKIEEDIDERRR